MALPDPEANQLQSLERPGGEVQLGVSQLAWRVVFVVRDDLDGHGGCSSRCGGGPAAVSLKGWQGAGRCEGDGPCSRKCRQEKVLWSRGKRLGGGGGTGGAGRGEVGL